LQQRIQALSPLASALSSLEDVVEETVQAGALQASAMPCLPPLKSIPNRDSVLAVALLNAVLSVVPQASVLAVVLPTLKYGHVTPVPS